MGRLYQRCHLYSQSERAYRLVLDTDPGRVETRCNLALILCQNGDKDAFFPALYWLGCSQQCS